MVNIPILNGVYKPTDNGAHHPVYIIIVYIKNIYTYIKFTCQLKLGSPFRLTWMENNQKNTSNQSNHKPLRIRSLFQQKLLFLALAHQGAGFRGSSFLSHLLHGTHAVLGRWKSGCWAIDWNKKMSEITNIFSAWWLTYPPEKYESVGMMTFPIYGTIKMFQTTNQSSMFIEDEYLAACPVCVHSMWHT